MTPDKPMTPVRIIHDHIASPPYYFKQGDETFPLTHENAYRFHEQAVAAGELFVLPENFAEMVEVVRKNTVSTEAL